MVLVKPCLKLEKEILAAAADDDENGLVAGYWPVGAAVVVLLLGGPTRGRRPLLHLLLRLLALRVSGRRPAGRTACGLG